MQRKQTTEELQLKIRNTVREACVKSNLDFSKPIPYAEIPVGNATLTIIDYVPR